MLTKISFLQSAKSHGDIYAAICTYFFNLFGIIAAIGSKRKKFKTTKVASIAKCNWHKGRTQRNHDFWTKGSHKGRVRYLRESLFLVRPLGKSWPQMSQKYKIAPSYLLIHHQSQSGAGKHTKQESIDGDMADTDLNKFVTWEKKGV